ncbi:HlyD family type I secretion periplasmic adaptor subunit [Mesorhizobium xinjiangense]|uniref:HlyD family type I secretion periplasmic adaptor subunit n=1 Tax=Mesorhizobium xinjiangense TaxID=2678685 RepID=UPI0012EE71B0|nr:HlyD family type I secretion periplasmic adaptor subunit [Mesorhizobium xinjiangense]
MTSISKVHDAEWYSEVPRSIRGHAVAGLAIAAVAFGGFGTWASTAPLAAAVIAQGSFVATGENKIIQHLEGGIIEEILVNEGDHVKKGDPLFKLDGTAAQVQERQLFLRQARLEAIVERLRAQVEERKVLTLPPIVTDNMNDMDIRSIADSQTTAFNAEKTRIEAEIGLLRQNIESLEFRKIGFKRQKESMAEQLHFLEEELEGKMILFNKGLTRKTEVNAIQRAMADARGQIGRLGAEISETQSQIVKHQQQIDQTVTEMKDAALDELQTMEAELDTVREKSRAAQDVLRRSTINAPVAGVVVRMYYHTAGGVIETGKKILEIVPSDIPLIIETQVQRKDIDAIRAGQKATVRLIALNQRTTPVLNGDVFYVSADALAGNTVGLEQKEVYLARIELSPSELAKVRGFTPTPGMPVEVMIQTAERTFIDYLTKPIRDSMSRAFMER